MSTIDINARVLNGTAMDWAGITISSFPLPDQRCTKCGEGMFLGEYGFCDRCRILLGMARVTGNRMCWVCGKHEVDKAGDRGLCEECLLKRAKKGLK